MKNIGIIIQARLGSSRLPKKVLMPLGNSKITVLEQVVHRASYFLPKSHIIVATTTNIKDKDIEHLCEKKSIQVFLGDEDDVLDRYYRASIQYGLEHIIRIGADSPLLDPELLTHMLDIYATGEWDYLSNTLEDSFPEGLNVEFFSFKSLQEAWENATLKSEREHVTPYIKKNSKFKKYSMISKKNDFHKRWTLDYIEDYNFINEIYKALEDKNPYFTTQDILLFLQAHPELEKLNQHIQRNEGYLKSLAEEQEGKER